VGGGPSFARKLRLLESGWRKDFEDAQEHGFTCVIAPGEILTGVAARVAYFRNAGISKTAALAVDPGRRRRDKTIRELETAPVPAQ
jgi:hypothetical protein